MLRKQTNLRPDIARLCNEGYEMSIEHGHLVMRNVPYVDSAKKIKRGALVSTLAGSISAMARPDTHVVMFSGEYPCDQDGQNLSKIVIGSKRQHIGDDLYVNHTFSSKPKSGYSDYHDKMTTYAKLLANPAAAIDSTVTARTGHVVLASEDSPFVYFDNASSRGGISAITAKLKGRSIAIVGLGGTGSYVLDMIAKTPVDKIHLFDGDDFEQHNAYRAPGAASIEQVQKNQKKVDYWKSVYSRIHTGIVTHAEYVVPENIELLRDHDMVFVCIDSNIAKIPIIAALEAFHAPFIDVGMGVNLVDGGLTAMLRTTTSTPAFRDHVHKKNRIPLQDAGGDNLYAKNIQVSELNALNACLAVIRWKKLCGFYRDTEQEHFSIFMLSGNTIVNEDAA